MSNCIEKYVIQKLNIFHFVFLFYFLQSFSPSLSLIFLKLLFFNYFPIPEHIALSLKYLSKEKLILDKIK